MAEAMKVISLAERAERPREYDGWRAGRPVEDPEKLKRWGFVTAKPSEFLVHVRRGRVLDSSGQGATCFKWPWDAVAIVPTSIQRLQFRADQVTSEKVGVEVVGLAVYRIAEPLLAYRVLNFSFPERAQEKLEQTLTAMFIGGARRIIATLSVEDCLVKRKSALATELLREIAPVVGGKGRPEDHVGQGWGVVIDTIEIQEVRVLSEKVFAAMQAPFRTALDQKAREAKAEAEKEIAAREATCKREIEEARIAADAIVREKRAAAARAAAEQEARDATRVAELESSRRTAEVEAQTAVEEAQLRTRAQLEERQAELARAASEARTQDVIRSTELSAHEAQARLQAAELEAQAFAQRAQLARADAALRIELRRAESDVALVEGRAQAEVELARAEVEARRTAAQAQLVTAEKLPELAAAVGSRIGEVRISQFGGEGNPFGTIAQAVAAVLELVKTGLPQR